MANPHTDRDEVLALAIRDLIVANKIDLELDDVLYGNHVLIPSGNSVIVSAPGKRRQLAGVASPGGRTLNTLSVVIELNRSKVGSEEEQRIATDNCATNIEVLLHSDTTIGGIIIHGFVNQVDRGETNTSGNGMFRTVRMLFEGQTKTYLSAPTA